MIYLALYGGLLFGSGLSNREVRFRRLLFVCFSILLFAFVAFRYEVGCDWSTYAEKFEITRYWDAATALQRTEPSYWLLNVLTHHFGLEFTHLNLFIAIPFFWGLLSLARREPDPLAFIVLSFPILIINMPMSAIRQAAAIGFICFAINAFRDRSLIRYVLMVASAATFHMSAIVFLALAPFAKFRLSTMSIALGALLVVPGAWFMFTDTVGFYAGRYVGTGIDAFGAVYRSAMLAVVGAVFFLIFHRKFERQFPQDYAIVWVGAAMMLATLPMILVSTVISDRFGYYVTPIQLMILARIPYLLDGKERLLYSLAPYVGLGIVLLVWTQNSFHFKQCYLPYLTWLSLPY
jgi:EpsG family